MRVPALLRSARIPQRHDVRMRVGDSVRLALDSYEADELEAAMLHACNAVDGTAEKTYPPRTPVGERFTGMIRNSLNIIGAWTAPGIDLVNTKFPVTLPGKPAPDLADVIYGIHRCTHGHGGELPDGFNLVPHQSLPDGKTSLLTIEIVNGAVRLPDLTIMGLCMVAVAAPVNVAQPIPSTYYIEFLGQRLPIAEWWGKEQDLKTLIGTFTVPQVTLNFGEWMDHR